MTRTTIQWWTARSSIGKGHIALTMPLLYKIAAESLTRYIALRYWSVRGSRVLGRVGISRSTLLSVAKAGVEVGAGVLPVVEADARVDMGVDTGAGTETEIGDVVGVRARAATEVDMQVWIETEDAPEVEAHIGTEVEVEHGFPERASGQDWLRRRYDQKSTLTSARKEGTRNQNDHIKDIKNRANLEFTDPSTRYDKCDTYPRVPPQELVQ